MTWPPQPDEPLDPHLAAFFDDMADHPDDPAVRFVFADWLTERDDPRAELLRLQGEYRQARVGKCDTKPVEQRVREWEQRHCLDWFGNLPAPNGIALRLERGLLEVMGYCADKILTAE